MSSVNVPGSNKSNLREVVCQRGEFALHAAILIMAVLFASSAMAQTQVNQPTTTTLFAGSQDITAFGPGGFTFPTSGVILSGTAISAITGQPVRHLWYGDEVNGLCRIDPEVDQVIPATAGIGGHFVNFLTCVVSGPTSIITPSQLTFDAATNTLYTGDVGRNGNGILRLHYLPSGDSGQGSFD